jgi:hypothetical protein
VRLIEILYKKHAIIAIKCGHWKGDRIDITAFSRGISGTVYLIMKMARQIIGNRPVTDKL